MMQLVPCGGCARHVRAGEGACPFCGAAVSAPPPRTIARRGATRAAIFYLGATLAACGGQSEPQPESTIVQPYGAPPDPDPPEPPPEPIEPEAIAAPYGAPPDPPPPPEPEEPRAIAPPYGAPPRPQPEPEPPAPEGAGLGVGGMGQPYGGSAVPPPSPRIEE